VTARAYPLRNMNERDEIISDQPFWSRLEYSATAWLATAADRNLRRFWIDGFIPEAMRNTNRGGDVEGTVWVGEGSSTQHQYRFVASVPQKLIHGRMQSFAIESILFDEEQHVLEIGIVMSKPIAEGAAPNGGPATPVGNSGVTEGRHRWADR